MQFQKVVCRFHSFGAKKTFTTNEGRTITESFANFSFIHSFGPDYPDKEAIVRAKLSNSVVEKLKDRSLVFNPGEYYMINGNIQTKFSGTDFSGNGFTEVYISYVKQRDVEQPQKKAVENAADDLPF